MVLLPDEDIQGIFNYCTRRCERCPFTARCTLYQGEQEDERHHPDVRWKDRVREGIDVERLRREADSESDPLSRMAMSYTHATLAIVDALGAARAAHRWPADVEAAFDTIAWHAGMLSAKVHRALHGLTELSQSSNDPVQNDGNGSAKVVLILVDESTRAWRMVLEAGRARDGSPLLELISLLERLDAGMRDRFPRAMEFVRPGFDQA